MPAGRHGDSNLHHVEFYVADAEAVAADLAAGYGFQRVGAADLPGGCRSVAIRNGRATLILTSATDDAHPVARYVEAHGDGVASIALRVGDATAARRDAVDRGARPAVTATHLAHAPGCVITEIHTFGDVTQRFVELPAEAEEGAIPWLRATAPATPTPTGVQLHEIDHIAICLPGGDLARTVAFYESALGYPVVFEERTEVGGQVMNSKVVKEPGGALTLVLVEPGHLSGEPGQVEKFVKANGGAGVQHLAFATADIVRTVDQLRGNGIAFLTTPAAYYELTHERLASGRHAIEDLRRLHILADVDQSGKLFQIFARSTAPRGTYFMEIIERDGATTFGSGNIRALYDAVEMGQRGQDR
ncbi:4-hydroxyphenylpyruvate dioxygenase [Actinoplanes teichomyceticus]|nr:4-hydroxyphenylpyruvate dioxygenase [Actinoplanes teichomyceticus]